MTQEVYPCGTPAVPPSTCPIPWLAPLLTPVCEPTIDIHAPI